jgi:hypothetical protein
MREMIFCPMILGGYPPGTHKTKITIYNLLVQQVFTLYTVKAQGSGFTGFGPLFLVEPRGHGALLPYTKFTFKHKTRAL